MKIKWKKQGDENAYDISEFISTINWSGSVSQVSRMLEVSVLYSPYDKNIICPEISLGDRLILYTNDDKLLIDIMVYSRERNSSAGTITYSGYDDLNRILKSKGSYNEKNTTPEKLTKKICNELKIATGNIAKTDVNIKSMLIESEGYYEIIIKAYTKAYRKNKKKYMPIMFGDKLHIVEKGEMIKNFKLSDLINITGSSYSENIDSIINKVKIYNDKGKQIDVVTNDDWIKSFGIFQEVYVKEEGVNAAIAAKNMLTGISKSASIEAIGNVNCIAGYGVTIEEPVSKLSGVFWIEGDSHSFENGKHTMSLDLSFKNIMDTK